MIWIFGRMHRDLLAFYGAGVAACFIFAWTSKNAGAYVWFAFIITALIDSGHVYTTAWRAFRRPNNEYRRRHVIAFFSIALMAIIWMALRVPYFWSFVLYFTLYHHIRQFYGFNRWYQGLNHRTCSIADKFLYALLFIPLVLLHVRPGISFSIYGVNEILFFPDADLYKAGLLIYALVVLAWIIFEKRQWSLGYHEINRLSSIAIPTIFHIYCFLIAKTTAEIMLPLLALHGVTYFAIMAFSLRKLAPAKWTFVTSMAVIVITAIIGGSFSAWLEDMSVIYNYRNPDTSWLNILSAILVVTPALWHYVVDGWIWKKSSLEIEKIKNTFINI